MDQDFNAIDRIRGFNRFYTRQLGLLQQNFLDSGLTLTEARVVFDIGAAQGISARQLANDLAVDEGQLSRLLKGLQQQGWIVRNRSAKDARRSEISLTDRGRAQWQGLVDRSRRAIAQQLGHLSAPAVDKLAEDMSRIATAMSPDPRPVTLRDIEHGDTGWLIQRHGELYARDEGFDLSFEALVAETLADFLRRRDPSRERAFIACHGTQRLGSVFCVAGGAPGVAKLRLFLLEPAARGQGLGHRMLTSCTDFARAVGYRKMVLWTHESHRAACALYAKHGFHLRDSRSVHSFGQNLVEQSWEIVF